jgi:carboxyl-terminal processing protease
VPEEAAGILGAFAPKAGPVLEIRSRHKDYSRLFEAQGRGRFASLKAAVLVDPGTAMAAEAFASALRELCGAAVIGETSAGNVSIVKTFRLKGGALGLTLTVAKIFPPSGKDLEEKGLDPDSRIVGPLRTRSGIGGNFGESSLLNDPAYNKARELLAK